MEAEVVQAQSVGLELTDAERPAGGRLLKLVGEIDRVEGYTEPHAVPLARLAVEIGLRAGLHGSDLTALKFAALAHDVGERALKREYLLRSDRLMPEERLDLVRHSILGEQAAAQFRLPRATQLIIRWHHEWWNGSGYPDGLSRKSIPIGARVLRAVDTYRALISDRPHRSRHDLASAEAIMSDQAGIECDPDVVSLLLEFLSEHKSRQVSSELRFDSLFYPPEGEWLPVHEGMAQAPIESPYVARWLARQTPLFPRIRRCSRWLGFELSVLRRLKFSSIAIPFCGRPELGWHLKGWGKQVLTNDLCQWSWWMSRALVENSRETLDVDDVAFVLDEASVPRLEANNPSLWQTMSPEDATWFDNVWLNIEQLDSERLRSLAYLHALGVGDYAYSFSPATRHLRRPLSEVFTALWRSQRAIFDNAQANLAANRDAHDFIKGVRADCMFVRLPGPEGISAVKEEVSGWRETWIRGTDAFWDSLIAERTGRLGDNVASKDHYLELVSDFFERARHIPRWAIAHAHDGFLSAAEIGELLRQFRRRVEVTYAKDFSGVVGGTQSYIMIAG